MGGNGWIRRERTGTEREYIKWSGVVVLGLGWVGVVFVGDGGGGGSVLVYATTDKHLST